MTLQFWNNKGIKRNKFIAFENAYHGDTFGSMSVGARNVFNQAFESSLFEVLRLPLPTVANFSELKARFLEFIATEEIAGFIFEPLVQGAAGMQMYQALYLNELIKLAKEREVISIADEVMTGFGRTGRFFASEYLDISPDIICLSKGLTGGYFPLGVTSSTKEIFNAFISEDKTKTFFHGHSYTAYPSACVAALASLDLMEKADTWKAIEMIASRHKDFAAELLDNLKLKEVRSIGTILAIELKTETPGYLNSVSQQATTFFLSKGIILRPLGNVIYMIPPYCIKAEDLEYIYSCIREFLSS
jgi:adenosylmethionine-8-amino-7-oxononanoate aminotransferase